jgi:arabinogalactan endo-1,4-beta-galactosidase
LQARRKAILASVVVLLTLLIGVAGLAHAEKVVIDVKDPVGDDRGPGYYGYPGNAVFKPGVFDITEFKVIDAGSKLIFKVYVRNLGDNPWKGPNGFCLQYTHIYVHTTMKGVPARMDTLGLNIALRSDYAWHFALLLAPGWGKSPVPQGQRAALYYANGTVIVQNGKFKVYADTKENAIVAEVDKSLLPDVGNVAKWKIVVALASYDGFGPMRVRVAGPKGGEWVLNGTKYATSPSQIKKIALAIAAGIEPRVLDLVIYSPEYPHGIDAETQYKWLDSYSPEMKTLAIVPGLPTQTVTVTKTLEKTVTATVTSTITSTTTIERTVTSTATTTSTVTATTTVTKTKTSTAALTTVGVVLFIIGFVIGYLVKRR